MSEYAQTGTVSTTLKTDERENIVKEFEWATNDLDKALGELTKRLSPLLRPDYDAEKLASDSEPAPPVSAVRAQLHVIHAQSGRVRWLLDRLEV